MRRRRLSEDTIDGIIGLGFFGMIAGIILVKLAVLAFIIWAVYRVVIAYT